MAFFGEDGLQRQLKQAQRDLSAKDREIGTMHLSAKAKDDVLKKLRLEIERLQEEREDLVNGAGSSSNNQTNESEVIARLKTEAREAQDKLSKAEMEKKRLIEEARQTSIQLNDVRLRKASGFSSMASTSTYNASPSGSRTSRRRSNSLASDSRVHDLEAELASLRQNAGSSVELDTLKTQLATARRELNKAINEKIWLESKAKKEVDAVKDLLENANYEIDGMRRDLEDGGSVSRKDMEKRQKVWEGEKAELGSRIQDLEELVANGQAKLSELQSAANEADRFKDEERSKTAPISTTPDQSEELSRLSEEIRSLQAELARARAHNSPTSSAPSSSSAELTIRRLERNLDKARRDTEALEESLNQAEEENQALRTRIPLPSSPGSKADDGKIVELEVDNERLQGEVSQLQEQIRSLRGDLATLQASLAKAQKAEEALERVQESLLDKEAAWNTERQAHDDQVVDLRKRVTEAEKAITSKTGEVEEKEAQLSALSITLASSESQIQQLTRRLESLASESLETEVSSLKATIETITKEKEEATRLSTVLQMRLDTIIHELSTSQEDLKVDRAELDVLRIQLADTTSKEAGARAEIEAVQDQLHTAVREKTNIENELAELRSSFADRSTESEAETRNGELMGLQSELDSARRSAEDRERALEQEIDGLKFVKEKDAETAQKRISDLQGQLTKARGSVQEVESKLQAKISELESDLKVSQTRVRALETEITTLTEATKAVPRPTSNPDRLGLLYSKIQSLRAERDELRLALSFAQNESRFTIRSVEADKQAAVEELEAVKSDLNQQLATHKTLEQEVSSIRTQLGEKEVKLEEIKKELAGVDDKVSTDKIAEFETEVASAKAERDHLVQELGESHRQIMELNHAMAMMRTNTDSDKRLRKISMERKVLDMPKITETSTGVALDRGPVEFGRRPGHARTKSEIATLVLPDQAQMNGLTAKIAELETEIRTLAGKLERRNATIATLQLENEKLGMAQELSRESAEEFDDLVAERDALQAELDGLRAELGAATSQTEAHIAQITELENAIAGLRSDYGITQSTAEERATRIAELEKTINSTLADVAAAKSLAEAHATTISTLEKDLDVSITESTDQSRSLIVDILAQRLRLSQAAAAWRKASSQAQYHATALASSNIQIQTLTEQVDSFEAERSAMSQQLLSHTQRGKALDTANEKVHDLESQVETLAAECASIAEQLDIVSTSEASLKRQIEESSATQDLLDQATRRAEEVGRELSEARGQISRLESEIAATQAASDSTMNEVENGLRQELDQVKAALVSSEARASESTEVLKKLSSQVERLESLTDVDNESMEGSQDMSLIERTEININHTANTIDSLRQQVASIETTLQDERARSEKLSTQSQELAARLAEVAADAARDAEVKDADLKTLQGILDAKHEEVRIKTERADELQKECEHLRVQVSELENKLDQAAESATDHTLALQTEKEALQEKLATTSEKADALRMEVSKTMSKNQRLNLQVTSLTTELEGTKTSLVDAQSTVDMMRTDMEKLEVEKEKTVGLLKYQETETMSRTNKVQSLERDLQSYKTEILGLKQSLAEQTTESGKLEMECAKLRSALAEAQAKVGSQDDEILKERIAELEASLTLKTQEVDEADDRTREAFKAKAKLDKKIAKLTRQLGDKELEANTKRNKIISIPEPTPAPAPAPTRLSSVQMPPPTSTIQRTPLRPVGNLESAAHIVPTPGTLKRHREGDDSEKQLPAEAIMLPPSAPSSISSKSPHSHRKAFTPKRTIGTENNGSRNIFSTGV